MQWNCFCCHISDEDNEIQIRYVIIEQLNHHFTIIFFFSNGNFLIFLFLGILRADNSTIKDYPWERYFLKELVHATNNFHENNKIGEGGFGSVYWGRTSKGVEVYEIIYVYIFTHTHICVSISFIFSLLL